MEIEYYLINPTGNITALVTGDVPQPEYGKISSEILKKEKCCEQVGFFSVSGENVTLNMAGGEFCGNASMSACALYAYITGADEVNTALSVSGTDEKVSCSAVKSGNGYGCSVVMPPVRNRREISLTDDGGREISAQLFELDGISHAVLTQAIKKETAEREIVSLCRSLGVKSAGLMLYSPGSGTVRPLVYVDGIRSLYWESSCASGTCALAEYSELKPGEKKEFYEPGGTLTAERLPDGRIKLYGSAEITEKVSAEI